MLNFKLQWTQLWDRLWEVLWHCHAIIFSALLNVIFCFPFHFTCSFLPALSIPLRKYIQISFFLLIAIPPKTSLSFSLGLEFFCTNASWFLPYFFLSFFFADIIAVVSKKHCLHNYDWVVFYFLCLLWHLLYILL